MPRLAFALILRQRFRADNPCPVTARAPERLPWLGSGPHPAMCMGGEDKPSMQWGRKEDHRFKRLGDASECREFKANAKRPAREDR